MSVPISNDDPFGRSTSGSTSYQLLTYGLVKEAFTYCGIALDTEGEALTNGYLAEGKNALNTMIATWQAQGIHLWTYQEAYLFLEAGVNSYTLEQVRATNRYLTTTTTTDIVTAGNTVELTSVSELDYDWWIGVNDSDCNIVWRQVDSVTDSEVTIQTTWPSDIVLGATVYYYQSQIRPVERVQDVRRTTLASASDEVPINFSSHQHFFRLPQKDSQGSVSDSAYDRTLAQGVLYVWQTPANSSEQIRFTYERKIEDFINNDDCPDFPKYWMEALVFNLAKRLAAKFNVPDRRKFEIKELAFDTLEQALEFDNETHDITFSLNRGH